MKQKLDPQLVSPSPSNNGSHQAQPWDVQVVSVAPESVLESLESAETRGFVTDGWAGILGKRLFVWPLEQSLATPKTVHTLYHPGLTTKDASSVLVAMSPCTAATATTAAASTAPTATVRNGTNNQSNTSNADSVHVYVAYPEGALYVWKLNRADRSTTVARPAQARLKIPSLQEGEYLSCIAPYPGGRLVVGSSHNRLWWCTQTVRPMTLQAQLIPPRSAGLLSRVFGTADATAAKVESVRSILFVNRNTFLSITDTGRVELWRATTPIPAAHNNTILEGTPLIELLKEVPTKLQIVEQDSRRHHHHHRSEDALLVLRAALESSTIQIICRYHQRIYWLQGTLSETKSFTLNHVTWLNRFHPEVTCAGLVMTHDQITYAIFQYPPEEASGPVTCLALTSEQSVMEVDMPVAQVPRWVQGTMGRDVVTHGCWALATTGLGIRSRFLNTTVETASTSMATPANQAVSTTLSLHLKSAFWQWYARPGSAATTTNLRLPPSLQTASSADLERAVLLTAQQLQQQQQQQDHDRVDSRSRHVPLEWHVSFLKMLQHAGLYRSLSRTARWSLLGIGQELAAYSQLAVASPFKPYAVAEGFLEQQQKQQQHTFAHETEWCEALCQALQSATSFRHEQIRSLYDIVDKEEPPARLLWTSGETLQHVLRTQLEMWVDDSSQASPDHIRILVTAALASHYETRHQDDSNYYHSVKATGIPLIRRIHDDALAFALSIEHHYYEGICQISLDHDKDDAFSLDSLLSTLDVSFAQFVLQWHADRGLYAHVLNHGRHCPKALLTAFLESDERLKPYRWIALVRNEQYDDAQESLLESATRASNLSQAKRALSLAKLASNQRRKTIDSKLELVQAQELLLDTTDTPLMPPGKLLALALDKLETSENRNDSIQYGMIGLAIAKSMDGSNDEMIRWAAQVWSQCILADIQLWMDWLQSTTDLTDPQLRETILETSVFGGLWMEVEGNVNEVSYGDPMEHYVVGRLGFDSMGSLEMKRLLKSVTSESNNTMMLTD